MHVCLYSKMFALHERTRNQIIKIIHSLMNFIFSLAHHPYGFLFYSMFSQILETGFPEAGLYHLSFCDELTQMI